MVTTLLIPPVSHVPLVFLIVFVVIHLELYAQCANMAMHCQPIVQVVFLAHLHWLIANIALPPLFVKFVSLDFS